MSDKVAPQRRPSVWCRPAGPANVWKIVEGQEKLADGTTRPVRFSIQDVAEERREEAVEYMIKYLLVDEPMCKSLNCANDPKVIHDVSILWNYCLDQGIVVAAYILDLNNQISDLAAINMLCTISDETEKEIELLGESYQSPEFVRVITEMSDVAHRADARKIYGVDKYIFAFGLNVAPHLRGQKLGLRMLEARSLIGKKYGIPASSTIFSTRVSQVLAERAGFKEKFSRNYADILDEEGKPFFPNIEAKDMKVMMKRLY